jgi:hypothetical protein
MFAHSRNRARLLRTAADDVIVTISRKTLGAGNRERVTRCSGIRMRSRIEAKTTVARVSGSSDIRAPKSDQNICMRSILPPIIHVSTPLNALQYSQTCSLPSALAHKRITPGDLVSPSLSPQIRKRTYGTGPRSTASAANSVLPHGKPIAAKS